VALSDLVDLDRYPIDRPDTEGYSSLVTHAREELAHDGVCVLDGFVRPNAIARILPRLDVIQQSAFHAVKHHNVYLKSDDPQFDDDHPRNAKQTTTSATLGYDHVRTVLELDELYRSSETRSFVAAALGHDVLYPYEDALAPISVLYYPPGSELGWHFDNSIFTVTIMLREAVGGASFEYAPFLLDGDDMAFDRVAEIVAGGRVGVRSLVQSAGTLVLFRGSRTLHRVTKVTGSVTRLLSTLSYSPEPGTRLSAVNQSTFYGRAIDGVHESAVPAPTHLVSADGA
jgi:predicted 2-oxoglutarate/Fe(II)-dependent dioxygenase YbiX